MSSNSPFRNLCAIITYAILPIVCIVWPFLISIDLLHKFLWISIQLVILCGLNLIIEKAFENDDMENFFKVALLITLLIFVLYWPFVVSPTKLAVIFGLIQVAVISIVLDILSGGDMDFMEIVFVIALSLLAIYWPFAIFGLKKLTFILLAVEIGVISFFVGAYIEVDGLKNFGMVICGIMALAWPWFFVPYNIAIIIILAELFILALIYEIFRGFSDDGIVKGMFVFLLLLAVGWPWLAFIGMEKYLWYAIPACIGSGSVASFIAKLVIGSTKN